MEQWKQIVIDNVTYDYEVSSHGNVRNVKTGRILKPKNNGHGYLQVNLSKNGKPKHFKIHRLVATMFIPNPQNLTDVDHIDNNKHNNHVSNLQWLPHKNNVKKARDKKVLCVETGKIYDSVSQASEETGYNVSNIVKVCQGKRKSCGGYRWEYVEDNDENC